MITALQYVIKNGLNSEAEYPYEGLGGRCRAKNSSVVKVKQAVGVDDNESALKEALGK